MTPALSMAEKQEKLSVGDLLADTDLSPRDLSLIFELTERVKASPGAYGQALLGKQLALIFEKPSLRTRVTFEVGMTSMGGFGVSWIMPSHGWANAKPSGTLPGISSVGWMGLWRVPSRTSPYWSSRTTLPFRSSMRSPISSILARHWAISIRYGRNSGRWQG